MSSLLRTAAANQFHNFVRGTQKDLIAKLKASAALEHTSVKNYVTALLQHHVNDMEKKRLLPKGK